MAKTMRKIFLSLLLISSFNFAIANAEEKNTKKQNAETIKMLNLFGDVFEKVREDYVEEVPDSKLVESAINGMLTALDPHSGYLDEKSFGDMQIQTRGEFGGLGIEVTMDNGLIKVVSPIDDTPAFKAGILAGDYISEIDGQAVMGMTLADAIDKLRGKPGSKVKLTILREGEREPKEIGVIRDVIKIRTVRTRKEGDIAYIRVTSFAESTDKSLKTEFEKLEKEMDGKMTGIVLDLRNNPGGLLDQAIAISDAFLERGEIVSTRGRTKDSIKRFNAKEGDITEGLPIVVLINGGSASASEIVSGALQDHKRAVVMGTKSFGKGSVQTVIPISGESAIRLTTSRYYTPSGHSIQAKGITPDIIVEPAKLEFTKTKNSSEADLIRHLLNEEDGKDKDAEKKEEEKEPENSKEESKSKPKDSEEELKAKREKAEKAVYDKDYQLARAIDLLKAISFYNQNKAAGGTEEKKD